MITAQEASRSLYGAWRLARFDANGITFFDNTNEAFWRSFWAAVIALPLYAILLTIRNTGATIAVGPVYAFFVHSIGYVIGWMVFPFAMYYIAVLTDRQKWFCRYIAAYNWAVVLQITLLLFVSSLAAACFLSPSLSVMMTVVVVAAVLIFQGFIAHVALQATLPGAVGIVFLDLALSIMVDGWSNRLLGLQRVVGG